MAREVPRDKPLSDEDRDYLLARGHDALVEQIDQNHPGSGTPTEITENNPLGEDDELDDYDKWTGPELEAELKRRNLPHSGTNAQRIERLRADDSESDDE